MKDITFDFLTDYRGAGSMYLCDAIDEFGWDGCGGTLEKAAQMAEFMQIESDLYDDLRNVDTNARIEDLADDDEWTDMLRKVDEWRGVLKEADNL